MRPHVNVNLRQNYHNEAYIPYSLVTVCRFFNVSYNLLYVSKGCKTESTNRKSNCLQISLHFLLSYLKTLSVGQAEVEQARRRLNEKVNNQSNNNDRILQLLNHLTSRRTIEDLRSQLVGQTFDIVFVQVGSWFVKR